MGRTWVDLCQRPRASALGALKQGKQGANARPWACAAPIDFFLDCMHSDSKPETMGKYLVSPLARLLSDGHYASSVSIRSGRGSGTHDRVLRFVRQFATSGEALRYAADQGRTWVREPATR